MQRRLVEAFDVIHRGETKPGPRQFGNAWPSIAQNFEELVDWDALESAVANRRSWLAERIMSDARAEIAAQHSRDADDARDKPARPGSLEIDMASEVIAWCARYLGDNPVRADALQLWALCAARGLKMAKVLRRRVVKADALLARRRATTWQADPGRLRRQDVMPGRVFTQQYMDLMRKEAAAIIARELNKARVMVR